MEDNNNNKYNEKRARDILFEQRFGGCYGLEKEKKEYFYNCLNAITVFDDYDLVDAQIEKKEDCFIIKGSLFGKIEKVASTFNCELYEENDNQNLYFIEIRNLNDRITKTSLELFTRKDDTIIHELYVDEDKKIKIGEYNTKDLNFVENKKDEFIKK